MSVTSKSDNIMSLAPPSARPLTRENEFATILEAQAIEQAQRPAPANAQPPQANRPFVANALRSDKRTRQETSPKSRSDNSDLPSHAGPVRSIVHSPFAEHGKQDNNGVQAIEAPAFVNQSFGEAGSVPETIVASGSDGFANDWLFANPYDQQFWQSAYLYFAPPPYLYTLDQLFEISFDAASAMPQAVVQYNLSVSAVLRPHGERTAVGAQDESLRLERAYAFSRIPAGKLDSDS